VRPTGSFLGWTNRERPLDDSRRKAPDPADGGSVCNARACALAVALVLSAGVHIAPAQAAGEVPGLSAQIQGIVSSALGATAAQPSSNASPTKAEDSANEAVALADNIVADALSAASRVSPVAAAALGPESGAPAAGPSSSEPSARARSKPARPRRAHEQARSRAPAFTAEARVGAVVGASSAWYGRSRSTVSASQTASAAPRPQRSAAPERPRPPGPAPPRPDASAAGQSGGQSTPVPSLLAALAGLLLIFGFGFLPRALPRSAFRKARLIALPPWHPG
jgi:hypothetical protein